MAVVERPKYLDRIVQDPEIMVGKPVVKGRGSSWRRFWANSHTSRTLMSFLPGAYPRRCPRVSGLRSGSGS